MYLDKHCRYLLIFNLCKYKFILLPREHQKSSHIKVYMYSSYHFIEPYPSEEKKEEDIVNLRS